MAPSLGTNLNWCMDWDPEKLPADLIWSARPWAIGSLNGSTTGDWAPLDSQGWPLVSVGTAFGVLCEKDPWPGVYKLSFKNRQGTTGDTVSSYGGGNVVLSNRAHDAVTNVTTYDVTVTSYVAGSFIWLRWAGSTGGVTDVHLMRPLKDASGWHPIGAALSDHIIDRLKWFTCIRTMQTQGGTGSGLSVGTDTSWSGRTKPWGPQTRSSDAGRVGGVAIENLVAMANHARKDLWINIPFRATDDYILNMAQAIRFGTDGTNPYTTPQASPVFAPLASDLKVYVEHANEIWNSGAGYPANENYSNSNSEIAAGDPYHVSYTASSSGAWGYAWRRVGWLAVRHSLIFRGVFGDSAMMSRVRPVLATQHGRYATTSEPLNYIRDVWGPSSAYSTIGGFTVPKQPVSYYLYGLATAPYVPASQSVDVTSAASMLTSVLADMAKTAAGEVIPAIAWNKAKATEHGIEFLSYEGGPNLIPDLMPGGATTATVQNARDANYSDTLGDKMGAAVEVNGLPSASQSGFVYGQLLKAWADAGAGLYMHFTLGQAPGAGGNFGLCPPSSTSNSDTRLETGPKWKAIKAFSLAWNAIQVTYPTSTTWQAVVPAETATYDVNDGTDTVTVQVVVNSPVALGGAATGAGAGAAGAKTTKPLGGAATGQGAGAGGGGARVPLAGAAAGDAEASGSGMVGAAPAQAPDERQLRAEGQDGATFDFGIRPIFMVAANGESLGIVVDPGGSFGDVVVALAGGADGRGSGAVALTSIQLPTPRPLAGSAAGKAASGAKIQGGTRPPVFNGRFKVWDGTGWVW